MATRQSARLPGSVGRLVQLLGCRPARYVGPIVVTAANRAGEPSRVNPHQVDQVLDVLQLCS